MTVFGLTVFLLIDCISWCFDRIRLSPTVCIPLSPCPLVLVEYKNEMTVFMENEWKIVPQRRQPYQSFQSIFTLDFQDIFNQLCVDSTRLKLKWLHFIINFENILNILCMLNSRRLSSKSHSHWHMTNAWQADKQSADNPNMLEMQLALAEKFN